MSTILALKNQVRKVPLYRFPFLPHFQIVQDIREGTSAYGIWDFEGKEIYDIWSFLLYHKITWIIIIEVVVFKLVFAVK